MDIHVRRITEQFFPPENASCNDSQSSVEDCLVNISDMNAQGTEHSQNTSFPAILANSQTFAQQTRVG